jgi:hypothetical protein
VTQFDTVGLSDVNMHPNTRHLFDALLQREQIRQALYHGGWLAGGFIRQVLLGNDVTKTYLVGSAESYIGDIDVFFSDAAIAKNFVTEYGSNVGRSYGGFASEENVSLDFKVFPRTLKFQYVDSPQMCLPFEESMSRFDFTNCKVAFKGGLFHIPSVWGEIETRHQLQISNNESPFLGSRILKYMKCRDIKTITDDSVPLLKEWIYRVAAGDFPGYEQRHMAGFESAIRRLYETNKMDRDFLTLFLGRWISYDKVPQSYGHYEQVAVDWALTELGKDKLNRQHVG